MAIDLRGTDKADIIERFLEDSVAQGNEGDATVERLELNGVDLSFRFQIKHKQVFKERVWLFVTCYGSIGGHKLTKSFSGKRLN